MRLTIDQRRLDRARGLNTGVFVSGYEGSPLGGLDLEMYRRASFLAGPASSSRPESTRSWPPPRWPAPSCSASCPAAVTTASPASGSARTRASTGPPTPSATATSRARRRWAARWRVVGDDPFCKSSTLPSSSRVDGREPAVPLLAPGSVADVLTLGLHAVALSRTPASGRRSRSSPTSPTARPPSTCDDPAAGSPRPTSTERCSSRCWSVPAPLDGRRAPARRPAAPASSTTPAGPGSTG